MAHSLARKNPLSLDQWGGVLALVLLVIALRYPFTPREFGGDTFEQQWMAGIIEEAGRITWYLNPFTLTGAVPLSYPIGTSMMITDTSLISGLSLEDSVLLLAIMVSIAGALGAVCLGLRLFKDMRKALLVGFFTATNMSFALQSSWGITGRDLMIMFVPFLVLLCWIVAADKGVARRGPAVAAVLLFVSMPMMHKTANVVVPLILIGTFLLMRLEGRLQWLTKLLEKRPVIVAPMFALAMVVSFEIWGIHDRGIPTFLAAATRTSDLVTYMTGYALEYALYFGPLLALLPVGIPIYFRKHWGAPALFVATNLMIIGLVFFWFAPNLAVMYELSFFPALIVAGWWQLANNKGRFSLGPLRKAVIPGGLAMAVVFYAVVLSQATETGYRADKTSQYMDEDTYATSVWLKWNNDDSPIIANAVGTSVRIAAYSNEPVLSTLTSVVGHNQTILDAVVLVPLTDRTGPSFFEKLGQVVERQSPYLIDDWLFSGLQTGPLSHYALFFRSAPEAKVVVDYYHPQWYVVSNFDKAASFPRAPYDYSQSRYVGYGGYLETAYFANT